MSSLDQSKYIADLVVKKTKDFKEVKELLASNDIISADATIVKTAQSIDEITHALTDQQASRLIDLLVAAKEPARGAVYSKKRVEQASDLVDDIKSTIAGWTF